MDEEDKELLRLYGCRRIISLKPFLGVDETFSSYPKEFYLEFRLTTNAVPFHSITRLNLLKHCINAKYYDACSLLGVDWLVKLTDVELMENGNVLEKQSVSDCTTELFKERLPLDNTLNVFRKFTVRARFITNEKVNEKEWSTSYAITLPNMLCKSHYVLQVDGTFILFKRSKPKSIFS